MSISTKVPFTRIIALDFETAWDSKGYTLRDMTTEEYIRDSRFKAWGCSYKYLDTKDAAPVWVPGKNLVDFFNDIDWSTTAALAHNAQFDVSILSWRYGHLPCFIFDTLSMTRALYGVEVGNSLAKLALRFNLPPKGEALHSSDGCLTELSPEVEEELAKYCCHDTALCIAVFDIVSAAYPIAEFRLIDLTLRMFVNPVVQLDKNILLEAIRNEQIKRTGLLKRLNVSEKDLASNVKFARVLRDVGEIPPTKISKTTGSKTYAFAKNDALFQPLINSDREEVALLCEARLAVKSTLERTRAQRFLDIANRGTLPVPLSYYAAHTGRWGGSKGSGLNLQNLKRGSFLRQAICAPEGRSFVAADLAQIEVRVLAWLSDYRDMLQVFASGKDPYAAFGAIMFGVPGMTKESHPELRQSAKSALLGCGFALGWANLSGQLLTGFLGAPPVLYGISFAQFVGLTVEDVSAFVNDPENNRRMLDIPHTCSADELAVHCAVTKCIVDHYRLAAAPVKQFWGVCDGYISKCLTTNTTVAKFGGGRTLTYKCLTFGPGKVVLPNGLSLRYSDIQGNPDEKGRVQWTYDSGNGDRKKLYGGKLTENIVQAVARIVMTDGMLRVQDRYPCVLTCHDETVALVPDDEVPEACGWIREQMIKEPAYLSGIPLDVTIGSGKRYGDAK